MYRRRHLFEQSARPGDSGPQSPSHRHRQALQLFDLSTAHKGRQPSHMGGGRRQRAVGAALSRRRAGTWRDRNYERLRQLDCLLDTFTRANQADAGAISAPDTGDGRQQSLNHPDGLVHENLPRPGSGNAQRPSGNADRRCDSTAPPAAVAEKDGEALQRSEVPPRLGRHAYADLVTWVVQCRGRSAHFVSGLSGQALAKPSPRTPAAGRDLSSLEISVDN